MRTPAPSPTTLVANLLVATVVFGVGLESVLGSSVPLDPTEFFPPSAATDGGGGTSPYLSWYESRGSAEFDHYAFLPSSSSSSSQEEEDAAADGVAVHWTIDSQTSTLRLAVAAPATGWVGFGLAEAGGMPGSDVVLYDAASDALTDAYVGDSYGAPVPDASQDWTLLHSQTSDGFVVFEAERALDTGDAQDRPVQFDGEMLIPPHRVIAAWGDSEDGVSYHGDKRARSAIRFYPIHDHVGLEQQVFAEEMAEEAEGYLDLTIEDYLIPQEDTDYVDVCFSYADLLERGMPAGESLHVIGFEPLIDSARHVHHIVMFGASLRTELEECRGDSPEFFTAGLSMAWGYAPGGLAVELPPQAGLALGEDGHTYFYMNIHYDNRFGDEGIMDSSGVRLYYTSKKRQYDVGVMQLGDPFITLDGSPVGDGLTRHDFDCPGSCTSTTFTEDVTVYKEVLHMHEVGASMTNELIRDGEVVHRATVEYWDFGQAGLHEMQQGAFAMRPGDRVRTSCFFNSTLRSTSTSTAGDDGEGPAGIKYGYGSQDEMCISYLHYYPKQATPLGVCAHGWFLPACAADYSSEEVRTLPDRLFGTEAEAAVEDDADAPTASPVVDGEDGPSDPSSGARGFHRDVLVSTVITLGCVAFFGL